jgi:hypothetical protein
MDTKEKNLNHHAAIAIEHAVFCTATDFLDPFVGQKVLDGLNKIFPPKELNNTNTIDKWFAGEFCGDFGAVPIVVMAQKFFPNLMEKAAQTIEPILGMFFKNGADKITGKWAKEHNVPANSPQYQEKYDKTYNAIIRGLPDAALWSVSSATINVCVQKMMGNDNPAWKLAASKAAGTILTTGMLGTARAVIPEPIEEMHRFTEHKIVKPVMNIVNKILCVEKPKQSWTDKVTQPNNNKELQFLH